MYMREELGEKGPLVLGDEGLQVGKQGLELRGQEHPETRRH